MNNNHNINNNNDEHQSSGFFEFAIAVLIFAVSYIFFYLLIHSFY